MDSGHLGIDRRRRGAGLFVLTILAGLGPALVNASTAAATVGSSVTEPSKADVWIDASGSSLPPYVGWSGPLVYVVGNFGPATATGVTAIFEIPTGLRASPTESCITRDGGQTCSVDVGSRFPGQAPRSSITIVAEAPGSYTIRASVTADQPDPVPANNVDAVSALVLPAADVSIQVTESADPSRPGRPVTYTAMVINNGPSPATGVALTDTWRASAAGGVKLLSFDTSQGACSPASGGLHCQLGGLEAGGSASITVTFQPRRKGTLTNTASITAAEFDPNEANNTDSETTTIGVAGSP